MAVAEISPPAPMTTLGVQKTEPVTQPVHLLRTMRGMLGDGVLLIVAVLLFPVVILLVGMPIAILGRVLIEITRRLL